MPTHPEVVTLDPNDAEQMSALADAYYDALDYGSPAAAETAARAVRSMLTPPLPEQPPGRYAMVTAGPFAHSRYLVGGVWHGSDGKQRTWPEVCALGTPEVLEPDSVKALREQVTNLAAEGVVAEAERDEARATVAEVVDFVKLYDPSDPQDTPPWALLNSIGRTVGLGPVCSPGAKDYIAPATEDEPADPAPVEVDEEPTDPNVRVKDDQGRVWRRVRGNANCPRCWTMVGPGSGLHRTWLTLLPDCGPLTLVETGGQS